MLSCKSHCILRIMFGGLVSTQCTRPAPVCTGRFRKYAADALERAVLCDRKMPLLAKSKSNLICNWLRCRLRRLRLKGICRVISEQNGGVVKKDGLGFRWHIARKYCFR